ncbi:glycosyltransferase, partial [Pseudomonas sp. F1_0610]|uniref:glycosyltransferase n=1 Tax=Pseudomonas sp. F1_0610 TaxID=3114284 RepID=UPI0039C4923D
DYLANSISNKIKLPVKSIRNLITTQNLTSDALAHAEKLFLEEKYTNKFKIASVGRLVKSKGVLDIIEFAEYLKEKNFDFVWYIFGDGELKNEIENKIIEKNLSEHLFLKGFVDNVDSYLKQFDLLVSFSYSEGLGLIIKEAIQANIAVATTPLPAFIEQLGDTGLYADHGDYDKWYQEIMLKLQSEQLRDKVVLSQTNHFLGKISSAFKTT